MAGIKGMANPTKVQPTIAQAPAPQADEFDYDGWAAQQVDSAPDESQAPSPTQAAAPTQASPSADSFDYDAWAKQQVEGGADQGAGEFTQEQPSYRDRFGGALESMAMMGANPGAAIMHAVDTGLGELPARAKASFQTTDKELKTSLEQSFGKENVRNRNGEIEYKGKDEKWRVWDNGITVEDFTVDQLRPVVEELPASLATLAASVPAVASIIGTGGAALPASAVGVALARSGGAVVGQAVGDFVQTLTGVPRDENRSAALEYGLTAVLAPASGLLADYATKRMAKKVAEKGARELLSPQDLYKEEISGIQEALGKVKELGGMENIPGTDTPVLLSHLNPSNPDAMFLTEKASSLPGFKQAVEQISQSFEDASQSFLKTLGNLTPDLSKSTGKKFQEAVESSIKQEGEAIGAIRQMLIDDVPRQKLNVSGLKSKIEGFAEKLGFNIDGNTDIDALKKYLVEESGYSKQAADVLVNKTNRMLEKVTNGNGQVTSKELVGMYEEINGVYRNVVKGGGEASPLFRQKLGEFRRFFADDLSDKVEMIADKNVKTVYTQKLGRYKELVEAADEFAGLLDKDNLASHSLSKAIFNKGANGLDAAEATKVLLRDRPDLLNEVKGSFLRDKLADAFDPVSKKTDWNKFHKFINSSEIQPVMESMFGKEASAGLKSFEVVAKAIQAGTIPAANTPGRAKFIKDLALSTKSVLTAGNSVMEMVKQLDSDGALAKIIAQEGIDDFLKTAPKESKPILKQVLGAMQKAAATAATVSEVPIRRAGKRESRDRANEQK